MKALLVDDEPHNCELMETLLNYHLPGKVEVVGHAYSVDQALEKIRKTSIELVFLDIQMPEKNGFELLKRFNSPAFEVVFVTSFDDFALPAIKADAIAYLLKPIDVRELKRAVDKAEKMLYLRKSTVNGFISKEQHINKIAVHEGDKVLYLHPNDLISFKADGRYTKIRSIKGQQYIVSKNLSMIEENLDNDKRFIRINRSVILNTTYVIEYSKSDPFVVIMSDHSSFEISRRKRKEILAALKPGRI